VDAYPRFRLRVRSPYRGLTSGRAYGALSLSQGPVVRVFKMTLGHPRAVILNPPFAPQIVGHPLSGMGNKNREIEWATRLNDENRLSPASREKCSLLTLSYTEPAWEAHSRYSSPSLTTIR
jgi:hypothetical protein